MKAHLLTVLLVFLTVEGAEALKEPEICYVLDGILFVYGIILTFLYCRLKVQQKKKAKSGPSPIYEKVEAIYTDLSTRERETYTTLDVSKPPSVPPPPAEETQLVE